MCVYMWEKKMDTYTYTRFFFNVHKFEIYTEIHTQQSDRQIERSVCVCIYVHV